MVQAYPGITERDCLFTVLGTAELPAIMDIETAGHAHPWSEGVFAGCFEAGYECWGVWVEGELAGFAVLCWQLDELHLLNLCVRRSLHRVGLGRRLLRFVIAKAEKVPATCLLLEVRVSNTAAIGLYTSEGFHEVGKRKGYYAAAGGREDALVMTLPFT